MSNHVNNPGNTLLTFFELERLLAAALLVIDQQWLDKLDELFDGASGGDDPIVLDHCLTDAQGYSAFVLELHVVHESRVVMHTQDGDRQRIQWNSQKLDEKLH